MKRQFKTSVITDEISQDLDVAIDLAKDFGLDAIEVRNVWNKRPHEWTDEEVAEIRRQADEAGLAICCVAPPFFKCDLDNEAEIEEHLQMLRTCCGVAKKFDTRLVRGFAFWREGPLDDVKDQVVPHLKRAAAILEEEGAILAFENEHTTYNNNVRRVLELIEAAGSDAIRPLFDPGNDVHDPEGEPPWPDGYQMAKDTMIHVHLKDPQRDPSTGEVITMPIGEGDIHARELMRALVKDGYDGYISLETHYRREPLKEEVALLPAGEEFSAGGYVATRECLEKWFDILAEIEDEN